MNNSVSRRQALAGLAAGALMAPGLSRAQSPMVVRIAKQFGISYIPMAVMEKLNLLEAELKANGVASSDVQWLQFTGGAPINDALISGSLEFASGGVGPLITIWSRTRNNIDVRGVAALNSMPLYLNTNNPAIKTVKDFTDKDRIALPAAKISIQAVVLQMACEQAFGKYDALDHLTVSMGHPDATAALLSGKSEITAHFGSAPFQYTQLKDPHVHRVLNSFDVLGGPTIFNAVWTTKKVRESNPVVYKSFLSALEKAIAMIKADPAEAGKIWIAVENSKLDPGFVTDILKDPENVMTTTPQRTMVFADFMKKTGAIKVGPTAWSDLFFPDIHELKGS